MSSQGRVGELAGQDGAIQPIRLGRKGAVVTQDAHAKYQEAIMRGNVYSLSVAAGAPTAYTGAAAGTPLLAIFNATGSGKALVALAITVGMSTVPVITTASAATPVEAYLGTPGVIGTGTTTNPTNMLTGSATGSVAKGYSNTVLTGQTNALNLVLGGITTLGAVSNATVEVGAIIPQSFVDLGGSLVIIPGNLGAIGCRTVPTSLAVDVSILWEEVPYP